MTCTYEVNKIPIIHHRRPNITSSYLDSLVHVYTWTSLLPSRAASALSRARVLLPHIKYLFIIIYFPRLAARADNDPKDSTMHRLAYSSASRVTGRSLLVRASSASAPLAAAPPRLPSAASRAYTVSPFPSSPPTPKAEAVRDVRLAGRRRFYEVVGVSQSPLTPWDGAGDAGAGDGADKGKNTDKDDDRYISSPISPGVDGTASASGVVGSAALGPPPSALREALDPTLGGSKGADGPAWHTITLDGRALRTPLGRPLLVPSVTLALAVAAEWDAQLTHLLPAQMPLTTLVCTALDQVPANMDFYRRTVLQYLRNDTACYLADPAEDRVLYRTQTEAWDGLRAFAGEWLDAPQPATAVGAGEGMMISRARKGGKRAGLPHPDALVEGAERWVGGLDAWRLVALQAVTVEAKSFLVGMAVVAGCGGVSGIVSGDVLVPYADSPKKAVHASRIEEEFQIEQWGLVEGGHDYDRLNCSIGVHSAAVLLRCLPGQDA